MTGMRTHIRLYNALTRQWSHFNADLPLWLVVENLDSCKNPTVHSQAVGNSRFADVEGGWQMAMYAGADAVTLVASPLGFEEVIEAVEQATALSGGPL